jgi:hypothetical protein
MSADILPICHTRSGKGGLWIRGQWQVPCYCMACGKHHGYRDEPVPGSGYVGYLCDDPCAATYSAAVGEMLTPDEAFGAVFVAEAHDVLRGDVTEQAVERLLSDESSSLAKLARDHWRR